MEQHELRRAIIKRAVNDKLMYCKCDIGYLRYYENAKLAEPKDPFPSQPKMPLPTARVEQIRKDKHAFILTCPTDRRVENARKQCARTEL